jgi:hypothetical protein
MAYFSIENRAGIGSMTDTGSVQLHNLGTIVAAKDATLGNGEFIYLKGAANTVVGSVVMYDESGATTTLVPTTGTSFAAPVAVAMSANTAGSYGWYQIQGTAVLAKGVVDFGIAPQQMYASGTTAGYVTSASASGRQYEGMVTINAASVASTTSTIQANINRPHLTSTLAL